MIEVTGSLQIKNNIYQAVLSYKENNKWKTKWVSTRVKAIKGNKKKAQAELEKIKDKFQKEINTDCPVEANLKFIDYMRKWLKMMKASLKETTYLGYKKIINSRMSIYFEDKDITVSNIKPHDIQDFYQYLTDEGLSGNTILHYHANIRKALQYAVKTDLIISNPADKVDKPKKEPYIANFYSKEEVKTLLNAVKGTKLEIPVVIACYYGLRRSEVLGIRWSAINFESKVITINHVILDVSENGEKKIIKRDTLKTKSSIRTLPLVPFMEEYFKELKQKQEENKKLCKGSYGTEYFGYVCVDPIGNIISPDYVSHQFTKMLNTRNLRKIRFHDLRHTCASVLLEGGIDMKEIQLWLGHSNYNTTANIYAHLDTKRLIEGADTLATAFASVST